MPRNGTGIYTLPQPAFTAGTVISSAAVNSDLSDIASALTGSLPRDGQVGMSGQLKLPDGSTVVPAMSFTTATGTGFSRNGTSLSVSIAGVSVGSFTPTGWNAIPVGMIVNYGGTSTPALWLLCFGQAVSRTTYAALFTAVGTAYGAGDGSTTFNVPDLRGSVLYGADNMGGSSANRLTTAFYGTDPTVIGDRGGIQSKQLATANLPAYTPTGSVGISDPQHLHNVSNAFGNNTFNAMTGLNLNYASGGFQGAQAQTMGINANVTGVTGSFGGTAQGGTSTAFALLPPGVIVNKIIYAAV